MRARVRGAAEGERGEFDALLCAIIIIISFIIAVTLYGFYA